MEGEPAEALSAVPFRPRGRTVAHFVGDVKAGVDFFAHNLPRVHALFVRINPYPKPWRRVDILCHDGAVLSGWSAEGKPGGPAILIVPGTFQTKDDTPRKRRAINLWRRFGAHVLIVDQRGFGGSHAADGTGGHHEALDVLLAAQWLAKESGQARVVAWGESLGGASALIAASLPGAADVLERVVAWSPFADLADAAHASSRSSRRGRTLVGGAYRMLLRHRSKHRVRDFQEFLSERAKELGMTREELVCGGSPCYAVENLRVPADVFHAEDDRIVPVMHARLLERLSRDQPRLRVHIHPRGGHLDFDRVAPEWFDATCGLIFERARP